jgi:hypothetical protein
MVYERVFDVGAFACMLLDLVDAVEPVGAGGKGNTNSVSMMPHKSIATRHDSTGTGRNERAHLLGMSIAHIKHRALHRQY